MQTDDLEKMLPCPFCGGRDCDAVKPLSGGRVHCYRCGADGPIVPYAPDPMFWTWNTRTPDLAAEVLRLREALKWYGEQARLCRIVHKEGDAGRHALNADGGKRARAALEGRE